MRIIRMFSSKIPIERDIISYIMIMKNDIFVKIF